MKKFTVLIAGILLTLLGIVGGLWLWVIATANPLEHPLAMLPIPVACVDLSCVTTVQWSKLHAAATQFASHTSLPPPQPHDSLSTVLRQRLVVAGGAPSYVTSEAVAKYRSEVLGDTLPADVSAATGLTLAEYDNKIVRPFLETEAIRQEHGLASAHDLYSALTQQHTVTILLRHFAWDSSAASIMANHTTSF